MALFQEIKETDTAVYLLGQLNKWADETPDAAALVFEGEAISFGDLANQAKSVAATLVNGFGVEAGDRVAYLGINHPDVLRVFFACARIGAIFAPFNSRLARDEYNHLITDAEPKVCLFDPHFARMAEQLDEYPGCTFQPTSVLQASHRTGDVTGAEVDENAPLLLVYTSGTTGRPKGVVLSHRAVRYNIANCQHLYAFAPGHRVLITLPLFHVGGLCILLLPALTHGATIHLHARFDPALALADIEAQQITTTIFVPAQMAAMMALEDWQTRDLASLTHVVVGSSLIPLPQIQAWHRKNIPVSQVYGATETGPAAIALEIGDAMTHEGSAGTTVKHCEIRVEDSSRHDCGVGDPGEILVRGPNILSGYWRKPDETDAALQKGWYRTGDVGYRDEDGFYWIVDRAKDVIISGGENIYPAEVEAVSMAHPAIAAIAVVGRPDAHWGETPVAFVECKAGQVMTEADYLDFLQDRIARYKQPKAVVLVDEMPRNVMGKIEKPVLRNLARHPAGSDPD